MANNFSSFINGDAWDPFHEIWYLYYGSSQPLGPFMTFYTKSIYYPYGTPLYFQVISPLHTLMFAGLRDMTLSIIQSYNFLYMWTFFVSGLTMYILAKYLTGNKYAAFFAGFVFAFSPIHLGEGILHLNEMGIWLIPLFVYFLIRSIKESKFSNAILAGILLALNAMIDLYIFMMCIFIMIAVIVCYLIFQRRYIFNKNYIKRFLVMFLLGALLSGLAYFQLVFGIFFSPKALGTGVASGYGISNIATHDAADVMEFFLPMPENPFLGQYTQNDYVRFLIDSDRYTYIGYTALALAIVGLLAYRKKREVWFWGVVAIVGALLAIGPSFEINGVITKIPSIWTYIYDIPLMSSFRAVYRFDYIAQLGIAILGAYGITAIMNTIGKTKLKVNKKLFVKVGVLALLCLLVTVEYLPIPYNETNMVPPPIYQIIAQDHSNFSVIEVPIGAGVTDSPYYYYQAYYGKPLVDGSTSRPPASATSFTEVTPFIDELGYYTPGHVPASILHQSADSIHGLDSLIAPYLLTQYNIKYIIVNRNLLPPNTYTNLVDLISKVVGPPFYEDGTVTAFEFIPPPGMTGLDQFPAAIGVPFFGILYGGWYSEGEFQLGAQAMDFYAGINVYSVGNQYIQLSFRVQGLSGSYPILLTLNNQTVGTYAAMNGAYNTYETPFLYLHQGQNQILFYSPNGCSESSRSNTPNCVSAEFVSIGLTPAAAP